MEPLLTPKEVAEFLKVSEATVRELAKRGQLPSIRLGVLFRFSRPALMRYFDEAGQGQETSTCQTMASTKGQTRGTGGRPTPTPAAKRLAALLGSE